MQMSAVDVHSNASVAFSSVMQPELSAIQSPTDKEPPMLQTDMRKLEVPM